MNARHVFLETYYTPKFCLLNILKQYSAKLVDFIRIKKKKIHWQGIEHGDNKILDNNKNNYNQEKINDDSSTTTTTTTTSK